MELVSQSALRVAKLVWRPSHGGFAFTLVCKATFSLKPELSPLAPVQEPVVEVDMPGNNGAIAAASELVPLKRRPEVLLTGHAYAPEGRPVGSMVARLAVGEIDKSIQIAGDRYFGADGQLGEAALFTRMPLGWDHASGGPETFNPAGRAIGPSARADLFGRVPGPNLLPPGMLLASRNDVVPPVGFGPIAPSWPSRAACLHEHATGWDPARWQEQPLPANINLGYFNAAPPDQQRIAPFGQEQIYLENLHPRFAHLLTRLAPVTPTATVEEGSGARPLPLRCDTLLIDTDRSLAMLVWRAHVLLDRPDRAGRVVLRGPSEPSIQLASWVHEAAAADGDETIVPGPFRSQPSRDLPFSAAGLSPTAGPPALSRPRPASELSPPTSDFMSPRGVEHGQSTVGPGAAFPPSDDSDPGDITLAMVPTAGDITLPFGPAAGDVTLAPALGNPGLVLPFAGMAPEDAGALRTVPVADKGSGLPFAATVPEGTPPAQGYPSFGAARAGYPILGAGGTGQPLSSSPDSGSATPSSPSSDQAPSPWMSEPQSAVVLPPAAPDQPPAPPELLGVPGLVSEKAGADEDDDAPDTLRRPAKTEEEGKAAAPQTAPTIDFDAYPPARCGSIAARVGLDETRTGDLLREEGLDPARWKRVHNHWLERIDQDVARSRPGLRAEYDNAYVAALEEQRGTLTVGAYAELAEAAERGAVEGTLAARKLPRDAWPAIHRLWLKRMIQDARKAREVRAAVQSIRANLA